MKLAQFRHRAVARTALVVAPAMLAVALAMLAAMPAGAHSRKHEPGHDQVGKASYLGKKFDHRPTASGELYDPERLTAAHRTLPFGTRVRVTNLENGRSVVVRINDRGPYGKGRVIDLSLRAARRLDFVEKGVTRVRLEVEDPQKEARLDP
jgi:rare lipoprotein A